MMNMSPFVDDTIHSSHLLPHTKMETIRYFKTARHIIDTYFAENSARAVNLSARNHTHTMKQWVEMSSPDKNPLSNEDDCDEGEIKTLLSSSELSYDIFDRAYAEVKEVVRLDIFRRSVASEAQDQGILH
mmetsp:Transcript_19564/g.32284  ORF Transcript_19564/g.32284 Transcript_19564/m.32284 type:complete len:130 (+) Transcript_19564:218-607(+)